MRTPLWAERVSGVGSRNTGVLLGVPIDSKSLSEIVQDSLLSIQCRNSQRVFACANPHSLVVAQQDTDFHSALTHADLVVADGVGASAVARWAGIHIGPRITGTDYFQGVLHALRQCNGGRVFFFGSSQHVLDRIAKRFARDFPSLTLCGTLSPPYGNWSELENYRMVKVINEAKPDVLWVGMTAPKQEKWVEANRRQLIVPVIGSIGAVFDFYAETYSRAPKWICDSGFEWAYRFILEPRRMWRRNFISGPKFIWLVLRRHIFSTYSSSPPTSLSDSANNTYQGKKSV